MKNENRKLGNRRGWMFLMSLALVCTLTLCSLSLGAAIGEVNAAPVEAPQFDPSPAIYVTQKNVNSVVGVTTFAQTWNRYSGEVIEDARSRGSGVVIADGGYVLTNMHVVENNDSFKVLMPNGERVNATLKGVDAATDLAVLKVDAKYADELVPVTIGSSANLQVGSTVIAIGNPGTEALVNTVTQGIVSGLERSQMVGQNTRSVDYIQHDASINSGNSGGGLFNYRGELVGINTLKYVGSAYRDMEFEGLAFAIPIDTAYDVATQIIENGKVARPRLGITTRDIEGPNEPTNSYPPASALVDSVEENSPAEKAGLKQYDFIYAVDDVRIKSFRELTAVLDKHHVGDTVKLTVVRYNNAYRVNNYSNNNNYYNNYDFFNSFFGGNFGYYNNTPNDAGNSGSGNGQLVVEGGFEFITVDVKLELIPEDD